jgi:hypothetical protein
LRGGEGAVPFTREATSFTEAHAKLEQLKALLLKHGVDVRVGLKLAEIFQSTKKYLALNRRETSLPPTTDLREVGPHAGARGLHAQADWQTERMRLRSAAVPRPIPKTKTPRISARRFRFLEEQ